MRGRRRPEIIAGRVNSDGTIAAGDGFTVQYTATGIYAVTITVPGFRLVSAVATVYQNAHVAWGNNVIPGERTFTIAIITSNTAAPASGSFSFVAVGVQQ